MMAGNYADWFGENWIREPFIFLICGIAFLDALRRESGDYESFKAHSLFRASEILCGISVPLIFLWVGFLTLPIGLFLLWVALVQWSIEQWSGYKKCGDDSVERFEL